LTPEEEQDFQEVERQRKLHPREESNDNESEGDIEMSIGGVPVRVQTAPGIKLLAQIPYVDALVNLPSLLRFTMAHFADLNLLKSFLQICECFSNLSKSWMTVI
jgi:hypothetical protein